MKNLILGAVLASLFAGTSAFATTYTSSSSQAQTATGWDTAAYWDQNGVPTTGDTAEVLTNGGLVRTGSLSSTRTFGGNSLQIDGIGTTIQTTNGQLLLRNGAGGTVNIANLILNGGVVDDGDSNSTHPYTLTGGIHVIAPSTFITATHGSNTSNYSNNAAVNQTIIIQSTVSGSSTVHLADSATYNTSVAASANTPLTTPGLLAVPALNIQSANNSFSGTWSIDAGFLLGSGTGSLGVNGINFVMTGVLVNAGNSGPLSPWAATLETDYNLNDQGGSLTINSSNNGGGWKNFVLELDQNWVFGAVTINGSSVPFGTYTEADLIALGIGFTSNNFGTGVSSTGDQLTDGITFSNATITVAAPEPSSLALLGLGVVGLLFVVRRRLIA